MTELKLPQVILGTMTFGDTADEKEAAAILDQSVAAGVTWIDTANVYAEGVTEELLAKLLPRYDGLVLATKAGMQAKDAAGSGPLSASGLRAALEASLRRLGRESVDILYLHRPDYDTPIKETLETVAQLVDEGKVGALGVSNYAAWQVAEIIQIAQAVGAPRPIVSQQLYNAISRRLDDEYAAFAEHVQLPTAVYNPLAGGLLTGRHHFDATPSSGRFGSAQNVKTYRDRYWDERVFQAVDRFVGVAADADLPPVELALRWAISRPVVNAVILGASNADQMAANLAAIARGVLPEDLVEKVDEIGNLLSGPMPTYNR